MKSLLTSMAVLSLAVPLHGTESTRAVVATQVAVPVGVPVAPFAPTYYQYRPVPQLAGKLELSAEQEAAIVDRIATRVLERLQGVTPSAATDKSSESSETEESDQSPAQQLIQSRCAACHAEGSKHGNLTGDPSLLSRETRQEVLLRVLSTDPAKRMPKNGPPLTEPEFLALFKELVH